MPPRDEARCPDCGTRNNFTERHIFGEEPKDDHRVRTCFICQSAWLVEGVAHPKDEHGMNTRD